MWCILQQSSSLFLPHSFNPLGCKSCFNKTSLHGIPEETDTQLSCIFIFKGTQFSLLKFLTAALSNWCNPGVSETDINLQSGKFSLQKNLSSVESYIVYCKKVRRLPILGNFFFFRHSN